MNDLKFLEKKKKRRKFLVARFPSSVCVYSFWESPCQHVFALACLQVRSMHVLAVEHVFNRECMSTKHRAGIAQRNVSSTWARLGMFATEKFTPLVKLKN